MLSNYTIAAADKIGSELVFEMIRNSDSKEIKATFDFKDWSSKINGKAVNNLYSVFKGLGATDVISKIKNEKYRTFLQLVMDHESRCSNMGTFLDRMENYKAEEAFIAAGINVNHKTWWHNKEKINNLPSSYSKRFLRILREADISISAAVEERYAKFGDFLCDMYEIAEKNGYSTVLECIKNEIKAVGAQWLYTLEDLINKENYNKVRLLSYVHEICEYEGLDCYDGVRLLRDYYTMQKAMRPNGNINKYPKYLRTMHDIVVRQHQKSKIEYNNELFKSKIRLDLECEKITGTNYQIIVPKDSQEVKNEGLNLSHCVGSYIDRIISGDSYIVFLRLEKDVSLITVEIRNNEIVQVKGNANRNPKNKEIEALTRYAEMKSLKFTPINF